MEQKKFNNPEARRRYPRQELLRREDLEIISKIAKNYVVKNETKLEDFQDIYDPAMIERDKNYVQKKEELFAQTPEIAADQKSVILEAIILDTDLHNWLGENVKMIKTSRYDDIANGVDAVAEFQISDGFSHLALAIDVTTSPNIIGHKIEEIVKKIKSGKLASVKYFKSDPMNFRGELFNLPLTVVGIGGPTVEDLSKKWFATKTKNASSQIKAKINKLLSQDPVQLQIIEEILLEIEFFKEVAEKYNQPEVKSAYEKIETIIKLISNDKQQLKIAYEEKGIDYHDETYHALKKAIVNAKNKIA